MANKGRAIYLVYTDLVDDKYDEPFNAWYDTRHLPQLKTIPGILDAARYVAVKGGCCARQPASSPKARNPSSWSDRARPRPAPARRSRGSRI
jgi:hypothetical protein